MRTYYNTHWRLTPLTWVKLFIWWKYCHYFVRKSEKWVQVNTKHDDLHICLARQDESFDKAPVQQTNYRMNGEIYG